VGRAIPTPGYAGWGMTENYPIADGAVVYDERLPAQKRDAPVLYHVLDVYEPRSGGRPYVRVADGTHTTYEWIHIDDFRDMFTPAGWQHNGKPTYTLTRMYGHKVYPKDMMTPDLYDG